MRLVLSVSWLVVCTLIVLTTTQASAQLSEEGERFGLPEETTVTKVGDEVFVNGVPMEMVAIAVPDSVKNTATYFLKRWTEAGWETNLERNGDYIIVSAVDLNVQQVATLIKTGENKTEGTISVTDLPSRLAEGKGGDYEVGKHLPKPKNTLVLNEVKVRDAVGESIMTTLANYYDVEQNTAFYRERMFELGWSERKLKYTPDGKATILVFDQPGREATFTILLQNRQTFVTVNWLEK
jgi:hypothetical protein